MLVWKFYINIPHWFVQPKYSNNYKFNKEKDQKYTILLYANKGVVFEALMGMRELSGLSIRVHLIFWPRMKIITNTWATPLQLSSHVHASFSRHEIQGDGGPVWGSDVLDPAHLALEAYLPTGVQSRHVGRLNSAHLGEFLHWASANAMGQSHLWAANF